MAETLLVETAALPGAGADDRAAVRRLADELLAEHADAGVFVAALVEGDAGAWETARPWVARLVVEGREAARRLERLVGDGIVEALPLTTADPVPPVVWAREVAVVQRRLHRVARRFRDQATTREQAAALREAVRRTKTVGAALSAAAPGA